MAAVPSSSSTVDAGKLDSGWTIWYDRKESRRLGSAEFRQKLQKIGSFDTVEGFWRIYLYLKRPSQLEENINLYLFRESAPAPMWESFPRGGCWILKVKKKTEGFSVTGKLWQDMILALIGEQFEEPDVMGCSISIRKNEDLISIWNNAGTSEIRMKIGQKLKEILDLEPSTVIEYKAHADSMRDLSSFRGAKPFVYAAAVAGTKG
jgi:translation initiation factor 4E